MAEKNEGFRLWWAVWVVSSFTLGALVNFFGGSGDSLWLLALYCVGVVAMLYAFSQTGKADGYEALLLGATLILFILGMAVGHWLLHLLT